MDKGLVWFDLFFIIMSFMILNTATKEREKEFEKRLNERLTQIEQKIGER